MVEMNARRSTTRSPDPPAAGLRRDREAESLRCLEVDHQLEPSRLLDREVRRPSAFLSYAPDSAAIIQEMHCHSIRPLSCES